MQELSFRLSLSCLASFVFNLVHLVVDFPKFIKVMRIVARKVPYSSEGSYSRKVLDTAVVYPVTFVPAKTPLKGPRIT